MIEIYFLVHINGKFFSLFIYLLLWQDGSHIKGLIVNFVHYNWPSLIKMPFLEVFITPIVKATKKNEELSFFSIPEFEEWSKDTPNIHTYKIKYYKGLCYKSLWCVTF